MLPICGHGPKRGNGLGFTVLLIKEDGGCYEVYALDEKGERGEFYCHPARPDATKR